MKVIELPIGHLQEASWNPNVMDDAMLGRLRQSIDRFGLVQNLVVRRNDDRDYEVLSGNQRLQVLRQMGITLVPCVIVDLDDSQARLLAQALNRVQGEDDLGLKAEMVREVLESIPQSEVLAILPESAASLEALSSLGETSLAEHLDVWQRAQAARLHHMIFQLSADQVEVVEQALEEVIAGGADDEAVQNRRGKALFRLCRSYLERDQGG